MSGDGEASSVLQFCEVHPALLEDGDDPRQQWPIFGTVCRTLQRETRQNQCHPMLSSFPQSFRKYPWQHLLLSLLPLQLLQQRSPHEPSKETLVDSHSECINIQGRCDFTISVQLRPCKRESPTGTRASFKARMCLTKVNESEEQSTTEDQVCRFEVAMYDIMSMKKEQSLSSLFQHHQQLVHGDRMFLEVVLQGEVLLPHCQQAVLPLTTVDEESRQVGMTALPQKTNHLQLTTHLRLPIPFLVHFLRQTLFIDGLWVTTKVLGIHYSEFSELGEDYSVASHFLPSPIYIPPQLHLQTHPEVKFLVLLRYQPVQLFPPVLLVGKMDDAGDLRRGRLTHHCYNPL